jgi:hypothetical protein
MDPRSGLDKVGLQELFEDPVSLDSSLYVRVTAPGRPCLPRAGLIQPGTAGPSTIQFRSRPPTCESFRPHPPAILTPASAYRRPLLRRRSGTPLRRMRWTSSIEVFCLQFSLCIGIASRLVLSLRRVASYP